MENKLKMFNFGWDENNFSSVQAFSDCVWCIISAHLISGLKQSIDCSNPADMCCLALFLCCSPRTDFRTAVLSHVFYAKSLHIKEKLSQTAADNPEVLLKLKNTLSLTSV